MFKTTRQNFYSDRALERLFEPELTKKMGPAMKPTPKENRSAREVQAIKTDKRDRC